MASQSAFVFLIDILFNLYLMVVILRVWLQLVRADFYNPFCQFVVKATHPVVGPLRRVLPAIGRLDTASLVFALVIACVKVVVLALIAKVPFDALFILMAGGITLVKEIFSIVFYVLILRAILSWVSQGYNPIEAVMAQLTEPMLAPIRRIIPPMGGLDLSMLVLIIALQFLKILLFGGSMF
ncbi:MULTISPECIES: YggT family protein [Corallincola]|uniref:YggT family protein n=3 Tax=Corallincola TaxID=1775176 RepID=A0A368N558_9GAMM|nr:MULTISPECIES: YggT family protein [Corallincola]RCU45648.1 YggT family protein [Corallincola holothuriorum]TAA41772.1 YggT family protein [Corallincola spongiicola]TCI02237.1 YggT family protein [Corallincola luteus]